MNPKPFEKTQGKPACVALVPARSGSKRVPDKNVRVLGGHPVLAYTIAAARNSGVFADVIVSTDDERYADIARHYGATVPFLRPAQFAGDASPDIEWVEHLLSRLRDSGRTFESFSLLRPTSPFRQPATIQRAWTAFAADAGVDSLRAVERCRQHPGKMWIVRGRRMTPLLPLGPAGQPWHSSQTNTLPEIHVQNASLEIAWSRVVFGGRTIAGDVVMPFLTEGFEGFDVNSREDWMLAERFVELGEARLPTVAQKPYQL
ncbi:MAG: acylneuraminate cytidylyltransferase family protein [Acidobacteria bacterium]|nr:acylneuraminate cytidylyltransferase family protein [Acidobacteriota bacterium]